jgi:hypothetical protein
MLQTTQRQILKNITKVQVKGFNIQEVSQDQNQQKK